MLAMRLLQLDIGAYREILFIYDQVIGGKLRQNNFFSSDGKVIGHSLELVREWLEKSKCAELRIGSSFLGEEDDGKLFIIGETDNDGGALIRFYYDPNFQRRCREADLKARAFETEIKWFLFSRGMAVPAGDYEQRALVSRLMEILESSNNDGAWISDLLIRVMNAIELVMQRSGDPKESRPLLFELGKLQHRLETRGRDLVGGGKKLTPQEKKELVLKLAVVYEIIGWAE